MKKIYNILLLATSVAIFSSCEKFLDAEPDMRVEINTIEKLEALLVSAYPKANYLEFAELYSDNVEDKGQAEAIHNDFPYPEYYAWKDFDDDDADSPTYFWNATYAAISAANNALVAIEDGDFGHQANQYKGEALIARAYNHFMLSLFFSKPYIKDGANNSLGIPYVKEPNVTTFGNYTRSTVQDNWEDMEKDLVEGLKLIQGGKWKVPQYHFTPAAANAFAARFYLFKEDWNKVIEHVTAIFPNGDFRNNLRPYTTAMTNYTFAQYGVEFNKADKPYNLLLTETYSTFTRDSGIGGARYAMGESKIDFRSSNTVFGAVFRTNNLIGSYGGAPNYILNKFDEYFHYTNVQAGIGLPYMVQALFTVDEALINRAEAYAHLEKFDLATKDLDDFASVRITSYNPANHSFTLEKAKTFTKAVDNKEAVIKSILDIKQKEFMQEGIRWMDILRHKIDVAHMNIGTDGLETIDSLKANDLRRVFQIPLQARNNGLPANER